MRVYWFISCLILFSSFDYISSQTSGFFRVRNGGGYMAKFRINFLINGQWNTYYSGDFSLGQSRTLDLPVGSSACEIHVENLIFIGMWRSVFSLSYSNPVTKCFSVWGTTLHPAWSEEDC